MFNRYLLLVTVMLTVLIGVCSAVPVTRAQTGNLAYNPSGQGLPSPLESDRGWGGGALPWDIVDGVTHYDDTWAHGLAFTGGRPGYGGEPCGTRQATISFAEPARFNRVLAWHHGNEHVPNTYHLEYWDGAQWLPTGGSSTLRADLLTSGPGWGSVPTESIFPAVTASKVRFVLNNCDIEHGWLYEFEVFSEAGNTISGRVTDVGGTALAGVSLNCGARSSTTDASGAYMLTDVPAGSCTLTPTNAGYTFTPASRSVSVPPNASGQDFTGSLVVTESAITGRVTDTNNAPVDGVRISLSNGRTVSTDSTGVYEFGGILPGTYLITAAKDGYTFSPATRTVNVPPGIGAQNFTAYRVPQSLIQGQIRAQNGNPLSGITITTHDGRQFTTDSNGIYSFEGLPAGSYTLTPARQGYRFDPPTRTVSVPPDQREVNFVAIEEGPPPVARIYQIVGQVTAQNGNGIIGVTISAGGDYTVKTVSGGSYTLDKLPPGTYTITPLAIGYRFEPASRVVTVPPHQQNVNFTAIEGAYPAITGRVLGPGNQPLAGVTIATAGGRTATTDANGYYQLPGLSSGRYTLTASRSGYRITPSPVSVDIGTYPVTQHFSAAVNDAPGSIAGQVYFNSADPQNLAAGILIKACRSGGDCATVFSDNLGQYRFQLAAGQYTVAAYPGGTYLPVTLGPFTLGSGTQLTGKNFVLRGADQLPPGTKIEPHTTYNGIVKVDTRRALTLTHQTCPDATVRYTIMVNGSIARQGLMIERSGERGVYTASVSALNPLNGYVKVQISATCKPSEPPRETRFDLYIDPSGVVQNTDGTPIAGALVTLWRAESAEGPFEQVLDGSLVMSAANRQNPSLTAADGRFAWDVIPGYYRVRAERAGCYAPGNPAQRSVESAVLTIPPPVTDLVLTLNCHNVYLPIIVR